MGWCIRFTTFWPWQCPIFITLTSLYRKYHPNGVADNIGAIVFRNYIYHLWGNFLPWIFLDTDITIVKSGVVNSRGAPWPLPFLRIDKESTCENTQNFASHMINFWRMYLIVTEIDLVQFLFINNWNVYNKKDPSRKRCDLHMVEGLLFSWISYFRIPKLQI